MKKMILVSALTGLLCCGAASAKDINSQVKAESAAAEISWLDRKMLRVVTSPRPIKH